MEFTIEAGELARVVGLVKGMVPPRTTIPILGHVLIEAKNGSVKISATCLEMEASATATAEVITPGAITVPGTVLFGLAKSLPKTKLATIQRDGDDRPVLTCGKSRYELRALDVGEFPIATPMDDGAVRFYMPSADLGSILAATLPAVSTEETRYYLNGVFLHVANRRLAAYSTDGHRLVRVIANETPRDALGMPAVIIPTAAVREIIAMAGDDTVDVAVSKLRIEVKTARSRLSARLIDGTYPDCERLFPVHSASVANVDRDELSEAVARAALVYAGGNNQRPVIRCSVNGGTLDLSSGDGGTDHGTESIDATDHQSGATFGIAANYLSQMVDLWPPKSRIVFQTEGAGRPVMLTSADAPNQTHVIMPMAG